MSPNPRSTAPGHRPFSDTPEPEPFYRTPEFRRTAALCGLLFMVGIVVMFIFLRQQDALRQPPAPPPADLDRVLSPEEVEARAVRMISMYEGALRDTQNGDPLRETEGYRRLGELLLSYTPAEVAEKTHRDLSFQHVLKDPDAWRGEFVRWRGVVRSVWPVRLRDPILGRPDVYRGIICVVNDEERGSPKDVNEAVLFDVFDRPKSISADTIGTEAIDLEGILYRTVSYEGQDGATKVVPYVLVRNLGVVDSTTPFARFLRENTIVLIAGMAFAVLAFGLLISVIQKRRPPGARKARAKPQSIREMLDERMHEQGHPPPPPPSS